MEFDFSATDGRPCAQAIAEQIAHFAGAEWTAEEPSKEVTAPHWRGVMKHTDGRGIFFRTNNGRAEISGTWPRSKKGDSYHPYSSDKNEYKSITATLKKGAAGVWNDIAKRFLDGYTDTYDKMVARAASSDDYDENTKEAIDLIMSMEIPGVSRPHAAHGNFTERLHYYPTHDGSGDIQVHGGKSISIDLKYIPVPLGLKVLAVLKQG